MSVESEHPEGLPAFLSDADQEVSEWTAEDREANEAEFTALGTSQEYTARLAAYISYDGRCGFASAGSSTYVVNRRSDRPVKATIRVYWSRSVDTGQRDVVKTIPAGSRVYLGCTRGGGVGGTDNRYAVVGAQVL